MKIHHQGVSKVEQAFEKRKNPHIEQLTLREWIWDKLRPRLDYLPLFEIHNDQNIDNPYLIVDIDINVKFVFQQHLKTTWRSGRAACSQGKHSLARILVV